MPDYNYAQDLLISRYISEVFKAPIAILFLSLFFQLIPSPIMWKYLINLLQLFSSQVFITRSNKDRPLHWCLQGTMKFLWEWSLKELLPHFSPPSIRNINCYFPRSRAGARVNMMPHICCSYWDSVSFLT